MELKRNWSRSNDPVIQEELRMEGSDERSIIFMPERGVRGPQALIQAYADSAQNEQSAADSIIPQTPEAAVDGRSSEAGETVDVLSESEGGVTVSYIPLELIRYSNLQIREVDEEHLAELARSIQERGVIQPVLVRPSSEGGESFELIAGERRLRAARIAGLDVIPALVTDVSDQDSLEIAIIENAQREDLNPIEEALAYRRLIDEFHLTQADVAQAIGKNRVSVANALRLLQLPVEVIELIKHNHLSAGHGRALLMAKDEALQLKFAQSAIKNALSVRALERLVQAWIEDEKSDSEAESEDPREADAFNRIQMKLSELLNVERVKLKRDSQGRRTVAITFDTDASWKRFMARMRE